MADQLFMEDLMGRVRSVVRTEARESTPGAGAGILSRSGINTTDQILFRLRQRMPTAVSDVKAVPDNQDFTGLWVELETCIGAAAMIGEVNPRHPGFLNDRIQSVKRLMRRSLGWYTRPLRLFHAAVIRALQQFAAALEKQQKMLNHCALQKDLLETNQRLNDVEQGTCRLYELTTSTMEKNLAQTQATSVEVTVLREELQGLREELVATRRQIEEALTERQSPK